MPEANRDSEFPEAAGHLAGRPPAALDLGSVPIRAAGLMLCFDSFEPPARPGTNQDITGTFCCWRKLAESIILARGGNIWGRDAGQRRPRMAAASMNLLDANYLWASLLWGTVGGGYCLYGWRQKAIVPLAGGIMMILASYLIGSALLMSLASLALMAAVYWLTRRGY